MRRMGFRWGESFMEQMHLFSREEIAELLAECLLLIAFASNSVFEGKYHGPSRLTLEMFGCEFYLELGRTESGGYEWVLGVANIPPGKRPRKPRSDAGKRALASGGEGAGAAPARARRPRRKTAKRVVEYLYKTLSSFRRKTTAFLLETSTMRDGIVETLRQIRVRLAIRQSMTVLRQSMIKRIDHLIERLVERPDEPERLECGGVERLAPKFLGANIGFSMVIWTWNRSPLEADACSVNS